MPLLNLDDQRFMALEGMHTWAAALLLHWYALEEWKSAFDTEDLNEFRRLRREFTFNRHYFLIAASQLLDHVHWAIDLDYIDSLIFEEFLSFEQDIVFLRNKNEHAVEYFAGRNRKSGRIVNAPPEWWHEDEDGGVCDPTATAYSRIGGRLDWNALGAACADLVQKLPDPYIRSSGSLA